MKRTLSNNDRLRVQTAARIIESNIREHLKIPELAEKVFLNTFKLKAGFKEVFAMGPYSYLQKLRMDLAQQMLREGASLRHIAISVGFKGAQAESNFIKWFRKSEHMPPGEWRQVHKDSTWNLPRVYVFEISKKLTTAS